MQPSSWPPASATKPLAVLMSGGLDSAVLLAEAAGVYPAVQPLYVKTGSFWEAVELDYCRRFLKALGKPNVKPLHVLEMPVADLYGSHWSLTGKDVPDSDSPDEAVFLPGRNVILLSKALLFCHLHGIPEVAMAPLEANPFPDATPAFFAAMAKAVNLAVNGEIRVLAPYAGLHKEEVIRRGRAFPLGETFSCIQPVRGVHCGRCNKCAERMKAFAAAGVPDPTKYA